MTTPEGTGTPIVTRIAEMERLVESMTTWPPGMQRDEVVEKIAASKSALRSWVRECVEDRASLLSRVEQLTDCQELLLTEIKGLRDERRQILAIVPEQSAPEFAATPLVERVDRLRSRIERAEAERDALTERATNWEAEVRRVLRAVVAEQDTDLTERVTSLTRQLRPANEQAFWMRLQSTDSPMGRT